VLISEVLKISFELPPVIDINMLQNTQELKNLIRNYNVTDETAVILKPLLEYLAGSNEGTPIMLDGPYGAGKSHTLCLMAGILTFNEAVNPWTDDIPITNYPTLKTYLDLIHKQKYLPISINCLEFQENSFADLLITNIFKIFNQRYSQSFETPRKRAADQLESLPKEIKKEFENRLTGSTVNDLIYQLRHTNNPEAMAIYTSVWKSLLNAEIKYEYDVVETLREISELAGKHKITVVLLLDELYNYILAHPSGETFHRDINYIQTVAEYCASKNSRIKLIGVNHSSDISEWGQGENTSKSVFKVFERFRPVLISYTPSSHVVRKVFPLIIEEAQLLNALKEAEYKSHFLKSYNYFSYSSDYSEETLNPLNYYPFHPELLTMMPTIIDRFGQASRTTLQFFQWVFNNFKEKPIFTDGKLNLISLPQLYDFFSSDETFSRISQLSSTVYAINETLSQSESIPLGEEIVKCLAIKYYFNSWKCDERIGRKKFEGGYTAGQLANLLQKDEDYICLNLRQITGKYIFLDRDTMKYVFLPAPTQNANELIDEIDKGAEKINGRTIFEGYIKNSCINVFKDRIIYKPVERRVPVNYVFDNDIERLKEKDGIIYVFPEESDQPFCVEFENLSKRFSTLIIIQLSQFKFSYTDFQMIAAIDSMLVSKKYESEYSKAFLKSRRDIFQHNIENGKSISFSESNYIYWVGGHTFEKNLDELLGQIERKKYPDFPDLNIDSLRNDKTVSGFLLPVIANLKGLFKATSQKDVRYLKTILSGLGLADLQQESEDSFRYQIRPPKKGEKGAKIWKVMTDILDNDSNNGLSNLYSVLSQQPFGLTPSIIDLYLCAYLAMDMASLIRKSNKERLKLHEETAKDIIREASSFLSKKFYVVKTHGISYEQLTKLASKFSVDDSASNLRPDEIISGRLDEMRELLKKAGALTDNPKLCRYIDETIRKIDGFFSLGAIITDESIKIVQELSNDFLDRTSFLALMLDCKESLCGIRKDITSFEYNSDTLDHYGTEKELFLTVVKLLDKSISEFNAESLRNSVKLYIELFDRINHQYRTEHKAINEQRKLLLDKKKILDKGLKANFNDCSSHENLSISNGIFYVCPNVNCKYSIGDKSAFERLNKNIQDVEHEIQVRNNLKLKIKPEQYRKTSESPRTYSKGTVIKRINHLETDFERKSFYTPEEIVDITAHWISAVLRGVEE